VGRVIGFDYTLRDVQGKVLDESGGDPLYFLEGRGQIIAGLEAVVARMDVGEQREVREARAEEEEEEGFAFRPG
jgi:FKBP-type peptidyl-prolyl cis-trans isomerase 2